MITWELFVEQAPYHDSPQKIGLYVNVCVWFRLADAEVALSLCGGLEERDGERMSSQFEMQRVTYESICINPNILNDPNLVVRCHGKYEQTIYSNIHSTCKIYELLAYIRMTSYKDVGLYILLYIKIYNIQDI